MSKYIFSAVAFSLALNMVTAPAQSKSGDSKTPRYAPAYTPDPGQGKSIEPKNLPDSATTSGSGTALRAEAASTTLPTETRLTLVLESPVDAKVSKPGDIFEAHVKDDLFLGSTLLLPKGSLVRGRVVEVTRARLISKAAKIALK